MEAFRYHVFVCDQQKPEGVPCCAARGSGSVIEALRHEIAARGLADEVQITTCGSLGVCERGPNLIVYPEGIWYSGLRVEDVPELVESQFENDTVLERLVNPDPAALRAEILSNRARTQAAVRARDAAGALPDPLWQTIRSFQESRVILTAIELDVFSAVGAGATSGEVAKKIGADARATEMLLNALVAVGLLAKRDRVFRNTSVAARFLSARSPDDARMALMHTLHLWDRWSRLTDCVRAGTAVSYRDIRQRGPDWREAFIAAMHRNAMERAAAVVRAVGVEGVRRLLDVGGGSGAYSVAFAQANLALEAEVLDVPEVIPIAQGHIDKAGLSRRVRTRAGDLRRGPLGEAYDLVFVSAICHMLSPEENQGLLARCHAALAAGGRVVIQDFILEPDKTAPRMAALFALNMLTGTEAGSSYSEPEYAAWLCGAGFSQVQRVRLPGPTGLMIGVRAV